MKQHIPCEILQTILECGPIIACDVDRGLIITANGAYHNVFDSLGKCWECYARDKDFYQTTAAELWDEGKEFFDRMLESDDSDEEE